MTVQKDRANALRRQKESLQAQLREVTDQIGYIESACRHEWGEVKFAPETYTSFEPNLTRPITHGIHLDYETSAVVRQKDAWTRECKHCGKVEKTTSVVQVSKPVPQF